MYSALVLDHFRNPRNVGVLPPPALTVDVSNPACGDTLRLSARFENGRVAESRYQCRGCTASIGAGSALTTDANLLIMPNADAANITYNP